jgi:hypothetical protein
MSSFSRFARACANAARTPLALSAATIAFFAVATVPFGSTAASADTDANAAKYYGTWNYDQPDITTLNNVTVLACPDGGGQCDQELPLPLKIPQVGWVVFSPGPHGTVNGHTDGDCTWNFSVKPTGLELSSTTQQCVNKSVGHLGNITKWSVQVKGNRETESITAVSHQPNGTDLIATMKSSSRTKVVGAQNTAKFVRPFLGDYRYDPADLHTLTNIVSTDQGTIYPQQGTVRFSAEDKHGKINAHTPDGCDWTLAVRGDTAELDPGTQTCHTAKGDSSLHYWALVTDDGQHMNGFLAGSTTAPGRPPTNTFLYIGALTRSATRPHK